MVKAANFSVICKHNKISSNELYFIFHRNGHQRQFCLEPDLCLIKTVDIVKVLELSNYPQKHQNNGVGSVQQLPKTCILIQLETEVVRF